MAKKIKLPNKLLLAGIGGGAVAVVLAVFVFGVGFDTLPAYRSVAIQGESPVADFGVDLSGFTDEELIDNSLLPEEIEELPIITPEQIYNTTVTSNSTIAEQIIETIVPAKTIKLEANIVRIDSNSVRYPETLTFDISQLALFSEDVSNIDYANGFVELGLVLVTDPDIQLVAIGTFDVLVNNNTVFTDEILLNANGMTSSDGKIDLKFSSTAPQYTFDFANNFAKFPNEATTKLSFVIKSLEITTDKQYGMTNQEIFSMDIFRDDFKILVTDTEGNQIRSYPKDIGLTITSDPSPIYVTVKNWYTCLGQVQSSGSSSLSQTFPAVSLGTIKVIDDETGLVVEVGGGTGKALDVKLLRNHNYTIDHSLVDIPRSLDPFKISTPKTQANYQYNVWTAMQYNTITGPFSLPGTSCSGTSYTTSPVANSQHVTSNFPK